jgi:hypothetical protein
MIEDHLLKENEIGDRVPAWDSRIGHGTTGMNG